MAYVNPNFRSKKALKEALAKGDPIEVWQPGPFADQLKKNGDVCIEGPHYPEPHKWYATGTLKDGVLIKVK